MKNLTSIILLLMSVLLIFLSQETFYSGPIRIEYHYDGDYRTGGTMYDKNDKKLAEFVDMTEVIDKRVVKSVDVTYFTFWGKARGTVFVLAIISTLVMLIVLARSNKDKIKRFVAKKP